MTFNRSGRGSPFMCCYKCPDKKVTEDFNCHTDCKRYAEALEVDKESKKAIEENMRQSTQITSFDFNSTAMVRTPKNHKPIRRNI